MWIVDHYKEWFKCFKTVKRILEDPHGVLLEDHQVRTVFEMGPSLSKFMKWILEDPRCVGLGGLIRDEQL